MKKIALIFLTLTLISCTLDSNSTDNDTVSSSTLTQIDSSSNISILEAREKHLSSIYDSSLSSIVHIKVIQTVPSMGFFSQNQSRRSNGSGFVWDESGHIVTNYHVIKNANKITVTLSGGDEFLSEVVGFDETSDIALLKLNGENFPYARMGNSDSLLIGEWVIALGNPFQLFSISNTPSASIGIISANHMDFGRQKSGKVFQDMIQTDAAINPGNSGGPLVNALGEVIGINTFIFTGSNQAQGSVGIGFAIPINSAKKIAKELRLRGEIDRGYSTGLVVQSVTKSIARYLSLPFLNGVIIIEVSKSSPAYLAGLKPGDIILKANGSTIYKPSDIRNLILFLKEGSVDIKLLWDL